MFLKKFLLLLILLLPGCGYHLRGDISLPAGMETIYLESASSSLQQEVKKALKSSQGKVVETAAEAGIVIKFANEEIKSRVMAINTAGRANQFQLIYQLIFSVYDASGKLLLGDQTVQIKREYFNDQTAILGKSNEEGVIRTEMYQQAVSSMMTRINVAIENKSKIQ